MIGRLDTFSVELKKVALEVGQKGNLGVTAHVSDIDGIWQDLTKDVNLMALNLTGLSSEYSRVFVTWRL